MSFLFKSRDISAVETRLSEGLLAVEQLQDRQRDAALAAVLSGNYSLCDEIAAQLRSARQKVEVAQLAKERAEAQQRQVELEAKAKERKVRARSLAQHLSRLQRAAADFESNTAMMVRSWQVMTEAAQAALAQTDRPIPELADRSLFNRAEMEIARQGRKPDHLGSRIWAPGSGSAALGGQSFHELEPLSKAIARISRWATERQQVTSPKPPVQAKAATSQATQPSGEMREAHNTHVQPAPAPQEPPLASVPSLEPSSLAADPAEAAAFRNLERLKNPHDEGTQEHSGFQAALAEMQSKTRHQNQGDRE